MTHIALNRAGCTRPSALNCIEQAHLMSCLHALGCTFVLQHTSGDELDALIAAIENRVELLPHASAEALSRQLKSLDWQLFMEEVADMHGEPSRGYYRETTAYLVDALQEAVREKRDLTIRFVSWV
jgi:hypothetical protein